MNSNSFFSYTNYTSSDLYSYMYEVTHKEKAFVCYIKGSYCDTLNHFFCISSTAFRFPDYFGENWAAFDECITDLEWLEFSKLYIIIDQFEKFFIKETDRLGHLKMLLKYLQIAFEHWQNEGKDICILINSGVKTGDGSEDRGRFLVLTQ